ncbi:MAG: trypsin-like peptidase domain-containing protein [Ruminococcus sp.]|jgi:serine protease Do|nr:trypsin-like peptidase domain-containing protein [Ruminococcus sp.]
MDEHNTEDRGEITEDRGEKTEDRLSPAPATPAEPTAAPPPPQYHSAAPNGYVPPPTPNGYVPPPPNGYIPPPNGRYNPPGQGYTAPLQGYTPPQQGYTPPPPPQNGYVYPPQNGYSPVPSAAAPKRGISKTTIVIIVSVIAVLAVMLSVLLFFSNSESTPDSAAPAAPRPSAGGSIFGGNKQSAIDVNVEQVDRPALPAAMYIDENSGLMTHEGVVDYVLPSSVLITVYGDQYFYPLAYGSGVVMSANGYIITNAHVIDGGLAYSVTLSDGEVYEASFIGMDNSQDVAVLKIEADGLTPATFGKTADVKTGEEVAIIASAGEDLKNFATFGYISNVNQIMSTEYSRDLECFQTDAAVNAGTSGGPAVNMYGQVIGIVVGKRVDMIEGMAESLGFLLQADNVIKTAEELIENGYVEGEVKLGIMYQSLDNLTASYYDLPSGLLVASVVDGSGAKAAGILPNDIITAIDGKPVLTDTSITEALEGKKAGDVIVVSVSRKKITGDIDELEMHLTLTQKIDLPSNESFETTDTNPPE